MNTETRFWLEAIGLFVGAFAVPLGMAYFIIKYILTPRKP